MANTELTCGWCGKQGRDIGPQYGSLRLARCECGHEWQYSVPALLEQLIDRRLVMRDKMESDSATLRGQWRPMLVLDVTRREWEFGFGVSFGGWVPAEWSVYLLLGPFAVGLGIEEVYPYASSGVAQRDPYDTEDDDA